MTKYEVEARVAGGFYVVIDHVTREVWGSADTRLHAIALLVEAEAEAIR